MSFEKRETIQNHENDVEESKRAVQLPKRGIAEGISARMIDIFGKT